jgi:hypothetical protein
LSSEEVVIDTNVFIRHGFAGLVERGRLSAVVLQEMTAGARDTATVRDLNVLTRRLESRGRLLVPNGEDWFYTGKVLNGLYLGLRARSTREPVAIPGASSSGCCATC